MKLNIGDTVQAKTGGPLMTVEYVYSEQEKKSLMLYLDLIPGAVMVKWLARMRMCKAIFKAQQLLLIKRAGKIFK